MKLAVQKTRSVFERYNIVSDGDRREAVTKLAAEVGIFWTGTHVGRVPFAWFSSCASCVNASASRQRGGRTNRAYAGTAKLASAAASLS